MQLPLRAYPRSFRRLLAVGFALVGAPAAIALASIAFSVSSFADRADDAIQHARQATEASREFSGSLTALERNARQMLILEDRSLLGAYETNRRKFADAAARLRTIANDAAITASVDAAVHLEAQVFAALQTERPAAIERFERLRALSVQIQRDSAERVEQETDALRATASHVRRIALGQAAALVPLVLLLIVGFTVLVGRPIRALDAAIRRLGSGNFAEPVRVDGPDDLVELGRRLDWMRTALIGLEQDKNRFMQEIAHSLKTSLAALREGSELLGDGTLGPLTDDQREIADILRRNALELQGLILGLVQYGQAWTQRTALLLTDWDCLTLLDEVVARHALAARAKGISIEADAQRGAVRADRAKVAAILDNLLSNAIRYSPQGGKIEIRARREDAHLAVEVADQGPGVAPEERERIFDPFVQGRAVGSGLVPGSGIGLAIAREHALAHGGSVAVRDSAHGACFRVLLPVENR
jgi:two-component system sensor histidine kinase GlrK